MTLWLVELLRSTTGGVCELLGSSLAETIAVAFVTASAGAFAGAYGAQRIAERARLRQELVRELRHVNAAISVAFDISNTYLAIKKQYVAKLKEIFDQEKNEFVQFQESQRRGANPGAALVFRVDLQTLTHPLVPIDRLQSLMFERLSVTGRALNLAAVLARTVHSLEQVINERNIWIQNFKSANRLSDEQKAQLYFGLQDAAGNVDENYSGYVESIYKYADDCIFFSKLLSEDLRKHGLAVRKKFGKNRLGGTLPNLGELDFSKPTEEGLIPTAAKYSDWTTAFVTREKRSRLSQWRRYFYFVALRSYRTVNRRLKNAKTVC